MFLLVLCRLVESHHLVEMALESISLLQLLEEEADDEVMVTVEQAILQLGELVIAARGQGVGVRRGMKVVGQGEGRVFGGSVGVHWIITD